MEITIHFNHISYAYFLNSLSLVRFHFFDTVCLVLFRNLFLSFIFLSFSTSPKVIFFIKFANVHRVVCGRYSLTWGGGGCRYATRTIMYASTYAPTEKITCLCACQCIPLGLLFGFSYQKFLKCLFSELYTTISSVLFTYYHYFRVM